ncbi:MAG: hypothetical protein JWL87_133 [Candidatus Adlerbacteria bacterium]|nr:hypothetical protein [Candidatus Adlerbacteria bacterium]
MNKYWFKKDKGLYPASWEGWVVFAVTIIALVQVSNIFHDLITIFVVCFGIAALAMLVVKLKSPPSDK